MSKSLLKTQCIKNARKAFKSLLSLRGPESAGLAGFRLSPPWISSVPQSTNNHCPKTSNWLRLPPLVASFIRAIGSRFSSSDRFHSFKYDLKCKRKARRYNKSYPGELFHFDSMCLPLIKGEGQALPKEYLFVALDDFSRELYAGIFPNKTQYSAEVFLRQVADECPYAIECVYLDSGKEFRGANGHAFERACFELGIRQKFAKITQPQSIGKTERVLQAIEEMWRQQGTFQDRKKRQLGLLHFVNSYNTVKPRKGSNNMTPHAKLLKYFYGDKR